MTAREAQARRTAVLYPEGKRYHSTSYALSLAQVDWIARESIHRGVSQSELVRVAINRYIQEVTNGA